MSFDTVTFWLFFPVVWLLWRFLPFAAAKGAALVASLVFYAWWNPWYVALIATSAVVDFVAAARIHAARAPGRRRAWLLASLGCNLGLLAVFKYGPFALENVGVLARLLGLSGGFEVAAWVIPVGISFYTFQTLSYSIDVYRGHLEPTRSFRDFFLFVAFFPQLVAGPIVRARSLLPQLERRRPLRARTVQAGLYFIVQGLFLKVVVADNLALIVDRIFGSYGLAERTPVEAWLGVVYFSVQIFADFAGYSTIAIGLAHLLGLSFPVNFRYPYISRGLSEFWTRWHVSLSQWLRDYLYVPLGGNRHGTRRTYANLMLTMLLGGLWHGASWTFVAWGGLHGLGLCVERAVGGRSRRRSPGAPRTPLAFARSLVAMGVVYVFVLTTWVFFRAESFGHAGLFLQRMFVAPFTGPLGLEELADARHLLFVVPVVLLHAGQLAHEWYGLRKATYLRAAVAGAMLFTLIVVRRSAGVEFIYFQF